MKKKLSYLLIIFTLFIFLGSVDAYTCKYQEGNQDNYSEFTVESGKAPTPSVPSDHDGKSKDSIRNWTNAVGKYRGRTFSGELYAASSTCPPVLLAVEIKGKSGHWYYYVSSSVESVHKSVKAYIYDESSRDFKVDTYEYMTLIEGPVPQYNWNESITFNFINDFRTDEVKTKSQTVTYKEILENKKLDWNSFYVEGYEFYNWDLELVRNDKVIEEAKISNIKNGAQIYDFFAQLEGIYKSGDIINLYADWKKPEEFNSTEVNDYNLGESTCKKQYVWNEKEINGVTYKYCNVDNLTYVACGDTKDIPSEVPTLISFAVNLLKIIAPLILIFVGIISLVKAIISSNEDEMKKAQKSLTKKIIPAVLIFFVISIVQFVIGLVADDEIGSIYNNKTEAENLSDCLDCFLNNNCEDNIYYRTNIGGEYYYYSVVTGEEFDFDNKYYLSTDFYQGKINTDCKSKGYFDLGYSQIYHPKAVDVNGVCYDLTKTNKKLINYTKTLDGDEVQVSQDIYRTSNGNCYYWEGRENDYIQISCDTEIVTEYYRGEQAGHCEINDGKNNYFYYGNIEGYQPRKIYDPVEGNCYYLMDSGFKYVNRTQTLFGEYLTFNQTVWRAGETCFYWSDVDNEYKQVACQDHDYVINDHIETAYYNGPINKNCEEYGYFDNYHPRAVKEGNVCYELTETTLKIPNYTVTLDGVPKTHLQTIYSIKGSGLTNLYYWEGRENDYIYIGNNINELNNYIITSYYIGPKLQSRNDYFDWQKNDPVGGYQPRSVEVNGQWYALNATQYKYYKTYVNRFGKTDEYNQKVWHVSEIDKCYYWDDDLMKYQEIECRNYN